jgi:hypothetical protein
MVLGYEVDFLFPDHHLIVIRFTHWQIAYEPLEVAKLLRKVRLSRP